MFNNTSPPLSISSTKARQVCLPSVTNICRKTIFWKKISFCATLAPLAGGSRSLVTGCNPLRSLHPLPSRFSRRRFFLFHQSYIPNIIAQKMWLKPSARRESTTSNKLYYFAWILHFYEALQDWLVVLRLFCYLQYFTKSEV